MAISLPFEEVDPNMIEEVSHCSNCNSQERSLLLTEIGYPYYECSECSLIYLGKRLKLEHLGLIYGDSSYHDTSNIAYEKIIAKKRYDRLGLSTSGLRIHEDGAGNGAFVAYAQAQGQHVTGSDLGSDALDKAKEKFNVDLLKNSLPEIGYGSGELDVVVAFNLMCHLYHPFDYIQEVSRILKPGGFFYMRFGNRKGKFLKYGKLGAPAHVFHFNDNILEKTFQKNGMSVAWKKPAFDSDYPYLMYSLRKSQHPLLKKVGQFGSHNAIRIWNLLGLDKEDMFMVVVRQ